MDVQSAGRSVMPVVVSETDAWPGEHAWWSVLGAALVVSFALKVANIGIGGPQYMIDDFSLYEGGFLVWVGHAPPQHAYIECWVCGLLSLAVYVVKTLVTGHGLAALREGYVIGGAARDFYLHPDAYYAAYRTLMLTLDAATAVIVYRLASVVVRTPRWLAAWVAALYVFTPNTLWCALTGRPDTLMALAATAGVYLYITNMGRDGGARFWWAAIALGLAAGLKMHGGLITVFVAVDIVRRRGLRHGWVAIGFAATAFAVFLVSDGSLLFDPTKYLKARWATYNDDLSLYLTWGHQFLVILRGSGWIIVPLALVGAVAALRKREAPPLDSMAVLALGWLAIFCLTRQLRGYWMLSALPLLYILAAIGLKRLLRERVAVGVAVVFAAFLASQLAWLSWTTAHTDLNELRSWVRANVRPGERFYTIGDPLLRLPKDSATMALYRRAYDDEAESDLRQGSPFLMRHLKNWEEEAALHFFDLLDYRNQEGYAYFNSRDFPPEKFARLAPLEEMDYLIVQQPFNLGSVPGLAPLVADRFILVTERRSEGGDGSGLLHRIYRRVR